MIKLQTHPVHSAAKPRQCSTHLLRLCILQKAKDGEGGETLDPSEKLFVVHVRRGDDKKERWDAGGPLLPNMGTALATYPHKLIELDKVLPKLDCTSTGCNCLS